MNLVFSDEELQQIEDLAASNYSPEKIALYFSLDKKEFLKLYNDRGSLVRFHYDRGTLVAEFEINQKQLELAKSGNITAAQIFLKESENNRVRNILRKTLFGDEH